MDRDGEGVYSYTNYNIKNKTLLYMSMKRVLPAIFKQKGCIPLRPVLKSALLLSLLFVSVSSSGQEPPLAPEILRQVAPELAPLELLEAPIPEPTPEVVPIPPSVQRPLGVEEGDRIFVKRFEVSGVTDRPELGIQSEEITALLESQRIKQQQLEGVGKDGFTDDERGEMVAFLGEVVGSLDLDMKFDDYQALIDKMRLEKLKREQGLTIGQLQLIADEITNHYRKAGFLLAQAYVPAQEVQNGVISLEVVEGELGQVLVEGNKRFSNEMLARPFQELIDAPVVGAKLESALSLLSDYPGVSVFGVLQPGAALGTTDLLLRVQKEERFNLGLTYDNFGSRRTGERRMIVDLALNSPLLSADRLSGRLLRTHNETNQVYGSIEYELPLFSPTLFLGGGYDRNDFNIGRELKDQDLAGESTNKRIYLSRAFTRSRDLNVRGKMEFTRKHAEIVQKTGGEYLVKNADDEAVFGLEASFDSVNKAARSIDAGTLRFDHGFDGQFGAMSLGEAHGRTVDGQENIQSTRRLGGDKGNVGAGFDKLSLGFARVMKLTDNQTMMLRLNAQYTGDPLLSSEQFSLGGPSSVRAFPVAEYLVDRGLYAGMDWIVNAPGFADKPAYGERTWGDIFKLSFFADYGSGWLIEAREDEKDEHLDRMSILGAGIGMELLLPGDIVARMQWATPVGPEGTKVEDDHEEQIWVDVNYNF